MSQIQNVNNCRHFLFSMRLWFLNTRWKSKGKQTHWEEQGPTSLGDSDPDQVWLLLFSRKWTYRNIWHHKQGLNNRGCKKMVFLWQRRTLAVKKSFVSLILCWLIANSSPSLLSAWEDDGRSPTVEETSTHSWTPFSLQRRTRRPPCDSDSQVLPEFNGFTSTEFHDNLAGGFCRPDPKHDISGATIIQTLVTDCICI